MRGGRLYTEDGMCMFEEIHGRGMGYEDEGFEQYKLTLEVCVNGLLWRD